MFDNERYNIDPKLFEAGTREALEIVFSSCQRVAELINSNTNLVKTTEQRVEVLGVYKLPNTPLYLSINGVEFVVSVMPEDASTYHVPQSVDAKLLLFKELSGFTPYLLLWADEVRAITSYQVVPDEPKVPYRRPAPPSLLAGIIRVLFPFSELLTSTIPKHTTQKSTPPKRKKVDPMLIAFFRVSRDRGVWVKIGEWYH